jgi:hypothetical protein
MPQPGTAVSRGDHSDRDARPSAPVDVGPTPRSASPEPSSPEERARLRAEVADRYASQISGGHVSEASERYDTAARRRASAAPRRLSGPATERGASAAPRRLSRTAADGGGSGAPRGDDARADADAPGAPSSAASGGVPGRRTVTIRGQGAERYAPVRSRRRRPERRYERTGFQPDKTAMWAVLLGMMLILAAAATAHAATLHALPHLR